MLVSDNRVHRTDPILAHISMIINGFSEIRELAEVHQGIYERGDFGSSDFLRGMYESYPEFDSDPYLGCYGVCDGPDNFMAVYGDILSVPDRTFIVMLTPIVKANQPSDGGWRWHKWGDYIGAHDIQCEYLYHEKEIEKVYCFHIYERL